MALKFRLSSLLGDTPAPIQVETLNAPAFEIGQITGVGAGKTQGLCAATIMHAVKYPGAKILIGRRTYKEMIDTVKQPWFAMARPLAAAGWFTRPAKWDFKEGTHYVRFNNATANNEASQVFFSNLDDPLKFRNEEFSMVVADQAEEIDEEIWKTLVSRVRYRGPRREVPPEAWRCIAAANDEGHNWVWQRFVEFWDLHAKNPERCQLDPQCTMLTGHPTDDGEPQDIPCATRQFMHATTLANRKNLSPRYIAILMSHPKAWRDQFIYAKMEGGTGVLLPQPHVVPYFDPPKSWPRYRMLDHALNSPACCLWAAMNPTEHKVGPVAPGAVYVYREYWEADSSVDQHAARIKSISAGEMILATAIDPSTLQRTQTRDGGVRLTINDLYAREGLPCIPSVRDPHARVQRIVGAHNAGMVVADTCKHLIEQMPKYRAKERPDGSYDIVNKAKFHSVDALGYGLMLMPMDGRHVRDPLPVTDAPSYPRRSEMDEGSRRHNDAESRRLRRLEEEQGPNAEIQAALGRMDVAEFWGDSTEEKLEIADASGWASGWGRD